MKRKQEYNKLSLALNVVIGVATFGLFCLLFPNGAVSTLMHNVFLLPGPGAGIGMIYAQILVAGFILSAMLIPKHGHVFPPVILSALIVSVLISVFSVFRIHAVSDSDPLQGLPYNVAAAILVSGLVVYGVSSALGMHDVHRRSRFMRIVITQFIGALSCLVLYWFLVFPNVTAKAMPKLTAPNALIMTGATLAASVVFSIIMRTGLHFFAE